MRHSVWLRRAVVSVPDVSNILLRAGAQTTARATRLGRVRTRRQADIGKKDFIRRRSRSWGCVAARIGISSAWTSGLCRLAVNGHGCGCGFQRTGRDWRSFFFLKAEKDTEEQISIMTMLARDVTKISKVGCRKTASVEHQVLRSRLSSIFKPHVNQYMRASLHSTGRFFVKVNAVSMCEKEVKRATARVKRKQALPGRAGR